MPFSKTLAAIAAGSWAGSAWFWLGGNQGRGWGEASAAKARSEELLKLRSAHELGGNLGRGWEGGASAAKARSEELAKLQSAHDAATQDSEAVKKAQADELKKLTAAQATEVQKLESSVSEATDANSKLQNDLKALKHPGH